MFRINNFDIYKRSKIFLNKKYKTKMFEKTNPSWHDSW